MLCIAAQADWLFHWNISISVLSSADLRWLLPKRLFRCETSAAINYPKRLHLGHHQITEKFVNLCLRRALAIFIHNSLQFSVEFF